MPSAAQGSLEAFQRSRKATEGSSSQPSMLSNVTIKPTVPAIDSSFEPAAVTSKNFCVGAEARQQAVSSNELHVLSVSRQTEFGWFAQDYGRRNLVRQRPAHFEDFPWDCQTGPGIDDEVTIRNRGWHAVTGGDFNYLLAIEVGEVEPDRVINPRIVAVEDSRDKNPADFTIAHKRYRAVIASLIQRICHH